MPKLQFKEMVETVCPACGFPFAPQLVVRDVEDDLFILGTCDICKKTVGDAFEAIKQRKGATVH